MSDNCLLCKRTISYHCHGCCLLFEGPCSANKCTRCSSASVEEIHIFTKFRELVIRNFVLPPCGTFRTNTFPEYAPYQQRRKQLLRELWYYIRALENKPALMIASTRNPTNACFPPGYTLRRVYRTPASERQKSSSSDSTTGNRNFWQKVISIFNFLEMKLRDQISIASRGTVIQTRTSDQLSCTSTVQRRENCVEDGWVLLVSSGRFPLRKRTIRRNLMDEYKEELQCVVCLEYFYIKEKVEKLMCGHIFHGCCIEMWLIENDTCPICRLDMSSNL